MNQKLTEFLFKKYPNLFSDKDKSIMESLIPFGLECGNGWYKIIDHIGKKLLEWGIEDKVIAVQVKEKFGGLRFYYSTEGLTREENDKVDRLIRRAESKSYKTCEQCGKPGKLYDHGWLYTACPKCHKERNKR